MSGLQSSGCDLQSLMDTDNDAPLSLNVEACENGVLQQLQPSGEELAAHNSEGVPNGSPTIEEVQQNLQSSVISKEDEAVETSVEEVGEKSIVPPYSNGSASSKESKVKNSADHQNDKPQKASGKLKNGKPSSSGNPVISGAKKDKDGKPKGTMPSKSLAKQPTALGAKGNSVTERNTKHVPSSLKSNNHSKQTDKTSSPSGPQPEDLKEKTKVKLPLKKDIPSKVESTDKSIVSPTSEDARSRRANALPSYGFSFKCNERAEKRKEFYSKLEEKIHAKEMEQNNIQAKTKESQEAEIKMFRKSLTFKATPMPTFYQEPPPPKVELKKIPPTRAKSPKLGRKKVSSNRLSLDQKVSLEDTPPSKDPSLASANKRTQRKSLPKLPSQNTNLSSRETKKSPHSKAVSSKETENAASLPNNSVPEDSAASNTKEEETIVEPEADDEPSFDEGKSNVGQESIVVDH